MTEFAVRSTGNTGNQSRRLNRAVMVKKNNLAYYNIQKYPRREKITFDSCKNIDDSA